MARIDSALRQAWRSNPNESFDVLLHVNGDLKEISEAIKAHGASVRRQVRMTNVVAVRCTGQTALNLIKEPWIIAAETDGPVKAFGR